MRTNHCLSNGCTSHVEPILAKLGKPNGPPTQCLVIALMWHRETIITWALPRLNFSFRALALSIRRQSQAVSEDLTWAEDTWLAAGKGEQSTI